jgi:hypothetical protein
MKYLSQQSTLGLQPGKQPPLNCSLLIPDTPHKSKKATAAFSMQFPSKSKATPPQSAHPYVRFGLD